MRALSRKKQVSGLIGWLILAYIAAAIGAVASINAASFYEGLVQPAWAPPAWLFGPMWTTLYGLMGVAAWLAWREPGDYRVRGTARAQRAMELALLRLAVGSGRLYWCGRTVGTDRHHPSDVLAAQCAGGRFARALPCLGRPGLRAHLEYLAAQSTDTGLMA